MINSLSPLGTATFPAAPLQQSGNIAAMAPSSGATALGGPQSDFASVLGQLATGAVQTVRDGEAASIAGMRGQLGTQDVVQAVMAAEQTLQTSIAIRDKVVSAYLEISRMSI